MAFSKKGKRRITVDDTEYFWSATGHDGWVGLHVMVEVQGGQQLVCYFDYHQDRIPRGGGVTSLVNQFVVTPYIVRQVIEYGLAHGWKPKEPGPEMRLDHLDDKIDLRLEVNRQDAIRGTDS